MILVHVQDKDEDDTVEESPETSNEYMALATRLDSDIWIGNTGSTSHLVNDDTYL